jgi:NAD(P)-dependent dehydrogenase (short-subunit alcohol dehydrogenase family)
MVRESEPLLEDKTTMNTLLVTGGAKGIGRGVGIAFAAEGWNVVIADADRSSGEQTAKELGGHFVALDVTDRDDCFRTYADVAKRHGEIDCLFNSAGITIVGPSDEMPAEDWRKVLDVNLTGTFFSCQAGVHHMPGGSSIINMASAVVGRVIAARAPYVVSKAGVVGLTQVLAVEWADRGIRVNAIAPAWVDTPFLRDAAEKGYVDIEELKGRTPAKRLLTVEEVAAAALYLASPAASYVSGHTLFIDAGWSVG